MMQPMPILPTSVNPRAADYRGSGVFSADLAWQPLAASAGRHPGRVAIVDGQL
ncbi:MAG: hypothetical protein JWO10_65, partial [Microbacteriaceae bacterium]|nr:hypothetical protein [Microbacteriaceae bacterium]